MKIALIILALFVSTSTFAAKQSAKVTGFIPYSSTVKEILLFKLEGNVYDPVGGEGCNTSGRFGIDSTNLKYKATLSAIIAAFHAQSTVTVHYLDTCDAFGNSADVKYICVGTINC